MAGSHADIPATRMALHHDGTIANIRNQTTGSLWTEVTNELSKTQEITTTNFIAYTALATEFVELTFGFPEPRDLRGLFWQYRHSYVNSVAPTLALYYSTDTTDGMNGTWTSYAPHGGLYSDAGLVPTYRDGIASMSINGVTGIRLRGRGSGNGYVGDHHFYAVHVYASRPSTGDRMAFWHPTLDQVITPAFLDFGDAERGMVHGPREFRIKNISASQTANGITIDVEDLDDRGFGVTSGLQISDDGSSWGKTLTPGNLTPGQVSATFYARLNLDASLGLQSRSARLHAHATSWS